MYECEVYELGDTVDCRNKAECLELMVGGACCHILLEEASPQILLQPQFSHNATNCLATGLPVCRLLLLTSFFRTDGSFHMRCAQGTWQCRNGVCREMIDFHCER